MGDFARVNAYRPRRSTFPGLCKSDTHKRVCIFCWVRTRLVVVDSEWHSVFSCPIGSACRRRFQTALSQSQASSNIVESPKDIFEIPSKCFRLPITADLAHLITLCRTESQLAGGLARFVVDLTARRQRAFAKLTVRYVFPVAS